MGTNVIGCGNTAICSFTGFHPFAAAPTGAANIFAGQNGAAGSRVVVRDSVLLPGTTGYIYNSTAAAFFDDEGGNTFTNASASQAYLLSGGATVRQLVPTSTYAFAPTTGQTNCASAASPAVCNGSIDGASNIAATATTVVVDTTAVTANSEITVTFDSSLGTKLGVTCSTQSLLVTGPPFVSARSSGTSFTVSVQAADAAHPVCFNWSVR